MKKQKNTAFVAVIAGLTDAQAANIQRDLVVAKKRHSPGARANAAIVEMREIGTILQESWHKCIEKKE